MVLGDDMKQILLLAVLFVSCSCFAETKTKNIQVSATVLPYCQIIVEDGNAKNVCYKNDTKANITKQNNTITIYY